MSTLCKDESSHGETHDTSARVTGRGARRRKRQEDSARRRALREAKSVAEDHRTAAEAWDDFYAVKPTFFKDRHILRAEMPELMPTTVRADPSVHMPRLNFAGHDKDNDSTAVPLYLSPEMIDRPVTFVEVGCGVGNALFPVLRANPMAYGYAFDFSGTAVDILRKSPEYHESRAFAFVADVTQPDTYLTVIKRPVNYVVAVWTLSAIEPGEALKDALRGLYCLLEPGGMVLVRDYAEGDMRMHAFNKRDMDQEKQVERLFYRGDRTLAYFFKCEEMESIMNSCGFETVECRIEERVVCNRKNGIVMNRRWLIGRFRRPTTNSSSSEPAQRSLGV